MVLRKLGAKAKKIFKDSRTRRRREKAKKKKLSKEINKIQREAYSSAFKEQARVEAIQRGQEDAKRRSRRGKGGGGFDALGFLTNLGNTDFLGDFTVVDPVPPRQRKRKPRRKKSKGKGKR